MAGVDNTNGNPNDINFSIKDTKIYVPVVTFQQKTIRNNQNFLEVFFNQKCIGMNIKQKVRIKTWQMSIDIFSNETL